MALVNSNNRKINASLNAKAINFLNEPSTPTIVAKSLNWRKKKLHISAYWLRSISHEIQMCLKYIFWYLEHPQWNFYIRIVGVWSILFNDTEMKMLLIYQWNHWWDFMSLFYWTLFEFFHRFCLLFPVFNMSVKDGLLNGSKFCQFHIIRLVFLCIQNCQDCCSVWGIFLARQMCNMIKNQFPVKAFNWLQFLAGFSLLWVASGWMFDIFFSRIRKEGKFDFSYWKGNSIVRPR